MVCRVQGIATQLALPAALSPSVKVLHAAPQPHIRVCNGREDCLRETSPILLARDRKTSSKDREPNAQRQEGSVLSQGSSEKVEHWRRSRPILYVSSEGRA